MSNFAGNSEKRQFGRRHTQLHAWVAIPGRPRLPCIVQDLSVRGALLVFAEAPIGLSYVFKLTVEATKFETACEIRHQRGTRVGVEFVAASALIAPERRAATDAVQEWTGIGQAAAASPLRGAGQGLRR